MRGRGRHLLFFAVDYTPFRGPRAAVATVIAGCNPPEADRASSNRHGGCGVLLEEATTRPGAGEKVVGDESLRFLCAKACNLTMLQVHTLESLRGCV